MRYYLDGAGQPVATDGDAWELVDRTEYEALEAEASALLARHPEPRELWTREVPKEAGWYPVQYSRSSKIWVLDFTENTPAADWAAKIGLPGLLFGPRIDFPPLP